MTMTLQILSLRTGLHMKALSLPHFVGTPPQPHAEAITSALHFLVKLVAWVVVSLP